MEAAYADRAAVRNGLFFIFRVKGITMSVKDF